MFTQTVKERDSIAAAPIYPQIVNGTTASTGALDCSKFNRVSFTVLQGTNASNTANISAYLQQTNSSDGGNGTNISGAAIVNTALVNTGFTIELNSTQLTARYVVGVIGTSGGPATVAGVLIGTEARYNPANAYDVATINQRVVV